MIARAALVLFLVALLPSAAHAGRATTPSSILAEADRLYNNLDYRGAAELAQSVIDGGNVAPKEQARAWERIGLCWLVLGQTKLSQEAFDQLFTLDPARTIVEPSLSPRQRDIIEHVRAKHAAPEPDHVEGPPTQQITLPVETSSSRRKPLVKRWYFWTPIAVGVVGVALGVGLGLGLPHTSPKGSLGTVGLAAHF